MRMLLLSALIAALPSSAFAWEYCYTHESYPDQTITVDGAEMVLNRGGESTAMTARGAGTGIPFMDATEEDGTAHPFRYIDGDLVFDMIVYRLGCPVDVTWVDQECKRILISQASPYSDDTRFYYSEPGQPITDCTAATPFRNSQINELRCSSGRTLKVDVDDYRVLVVDGVEMAEQYTPLPCRAPSQP